MDRLILEDCAQFVEIARLHCHINSLILTGDYSFKRKEDNNLTEQLSCIMRLSDSESSF